MFSIVITPNIEFWYFVVNRLDGMNTNLLWMVTG